jgi:hypothetical protein
MDMVKLANDLFRQMTRHPRHDPDTTGENDPQQEWTQRDREEYEAWLDATQQPREP